MHLPCPPQDFLRSGCDLEVSLKDLRLLLPTLSADAAAIAGQAVALSQWHQVRTQAWATGFGQVGSSSIREHPVQGRQWHSVALGQ